VSASVFGDFLKKLNRLILKKHVCVRNLVSFWEKLQLKLSIARIAASSHRGSTLKWT